MKTKIELHHLLRRVLLLVFTAVLFIYAQEKEPEPVEYIYKTVDSTSLKAYVFLPERVKEDDIRSAVLVFHGGGWNEGTPEWAFSRGRHFVKQGLVSVAVQYRLSNGDNLTPVNAMEDAKDAVIWMRSMAEEFDIDTSKVAAYGWSAGGHLAASTAIFNKSSQGISSAPNAVLLVSPALDLVNDPYVKDLLNGVKDVSEISPLEHIRSGLPPMIIVHGREDTLTPLEGVESFTEGMNEAGNICLLFIYDHVGHMFTPDTESDRGWPNPDQKIKAEAYNEIDLFLRELGFGNKPYQ